MHRIDANIMIIDSDGTGRQRSFAAFCTEQRYDRAEIARLVQEINDCGEAIRKIGGKAVTIRIAAAT